LLVVAGQNIQDCIRIEESSWEKNENQFELFPANNFYLHFVDTFVAKQQKWRAEPHQTTKMQL
jgi:hypothetical protein